MRVASAVARQLLDCRLSARDRRNRPRSGRRRTRRPALVLWDRGAIGMVRRARSVLGSVIGERRSFHHRLERWVIS